MLADPAWEDLSRGWCERELGVDGEQLLEQFVAHGDARDGVAGVGDKTPGNLEPVVA